ncbi:unnamed protein product [Paramecium sonneborni]|uniref:Transmembrane protein n=1 Tax=Paramecium sonneborni TaxID=65129 RepID=A0A8S1LQR1_9CILI|nr:unnamed protein product [Paramecium sonneborni]
MIMIFMIFVIHAKDIIMDINLNEVVQGNIIEFDQDTYILRVRDPNYFKHQALILNAFSQHENYKVYVNCDTQPNLFHQYQWQSTSLQSLQKQLKISYQQRLYENCSDDIFFITVLSDTTSTYELVIFLFDGIHSLEYNIPFNGELIPQEILQFKVQPSYLNEEIIVEIKLEQAKKYLKKCTQKDCFITKLDYKNTQNEMFLENDSYKFINSNCENCYYLIGLLSDYQQDYRIIQINNHSHIFLKEGHFDQLQIDQKSAIYYSYQISDIQNIKKSKFYLTHIIGSCMLYGSSYNLYPNQTNYEQKDEFQIIINNTNKYFLTVFTTSYCKYSIHIQVERDQIINSTLFKQLQNGISELHQQVELYSFFMIQLELQTNFTITLQSNVGDFIMFVKSNINDNEIPDSNSFQWKGSKQIDIKIDQQNQAKFYYIGVLSLNSQGEFYIEYNLDVEIKSYEIGNQIKDSVNENQINYYKLPMVGKDLVLIKQIYSENLISDLIIYISLTQTNTFPNELLNDYVFLNQSLTIQKEEVLCNSNQKQNRTQCLIYLSVTSKNGLIIYKIFANQLNNKIRLYEGFPLKCKFQQDALFYYILNENEVMIQWQSEGRSQANLLAYLGFLNDSSTYYVEFKSQSQNLNNSIQTIIIPENNQNYVLYILVQLSQKHFENEGYSIGVYETIKILKKQERIKNNIQKGQIQFYKLTLTENIKSIIFNIQVQGSQDSIIVLFQQSQNSRPNILDDSIQVSLRINSFYIFGNDQSIYFEKDQYMLRIQGLEDCELQISYELQDVYFQFIPNGYIPLEILQDSIPTVYLYIEKESFKIILAVFSGAIQIRVKCFFERIDSFDFADSFILDDITRKFKLYQFNACLSEQCYYLIQIIKIQERTQGTIQIQRNKQTIELLENTYQFQMLRQHQIVEYIYTSQYNFFIKLDHVFGYIQVEVKEENNSSDYQQNSQNTQVVNNSTIIDYFRTSYQIEKFVIKIQCLTQNATFQILIQRKNRRMSSLNLGQIIDMQLAKPEKVTFYYQSLRNDQNSNDTSKFLILQIQSVFHSIDIFEIQIKHSTTNKIVYIKKQFQRGIYFKLYDVFGMYFLIITPMQSLSYIKIILTDENTNILIDGIPQYQLTRVGQPNFYQVSFQQNSTLLLEVVACKGSVLIQGTSNPSNLNKQIFEIQIMSKPQQYFNTILKLEQGIYYFLVKLISSSVKDEKQNRISKYYIRQQTFQRSNPISYNSFWFKNLNLNWEIIKNELTLEIPNLIYDSQFIQNLPFSIYYIIQVCQQDEINCFYEQYTIDKQNKTQFLRIIDQLPKEQSIKVNLGIQDQSKMFISIIGKVEIEQDLELQELTFPFPITELDIQVMQDQEVNYHQGYLILILIILILLISILMYRNRKKKVKNQKVVIQKIEMNYQKIQIK